MATDIVMPRLSDSMEEGTVLKWMKAVGDEVALGEELVEIETDKANMVFESDAAGTLIEIIAPEGETLPIGEVIARVGEAGEAPSGDGGGGDGAADEGASGGEGEGRGGGDPATGRSAVQAPPAAPAGPRVHAAEAPSEVPTPSPPETDAPRSPADAPATPAPASSEASPTQPVVVEGDGRVKASPLARRVARQKGVDLSSLTGSGPGGRIIKADVEGARAGGAPAPPPPPRRPPPPRPPPPRQAPRSGRRPRRARSSWSS